MFEKTGDNIIVKHSPQSIDIIKFSFQFYNINLYIASGSLIKITNYNRKNLLTLKDSSKM